jgi:hypothetical protein
VGTHRFPASPPRGSTIDVFDNGGGRSRILAPPRGPAIDISNNGSGRSQTPVIATNGAHHQRLRQWWWAHPDSRHRLPGGPPSTLPTMVVDAPGLLTSPPIDLPSTSVTMVMSAPGLPASPPRGPAIDVFDNGGGHSWTPVIAPRRPAVDVYDINESTLNHLCSVYPTQPH